jgi:hypothetical protein
MIHGGLPCFHCCNRNVTFGWRRITCRAIWYAQPKKCIPITRPDAGHRAVPDCVKPAGGGGFTQLFFEEAGVLPVAAIQPNWLDCRNRERDKASFCAIAPMGGD